MNIGQTMYQGQRLNQQLNLAPQLLNWLQLLQAPTMELSSMVQHELESNPALELSDPLYEPAEHPGPIRIPSIAGIDAVLNRVHHNYLYMCAKEDFSGTHNFARTYEDHMKNAAKYSNALNEHGIK